MDETKNTSNETEVVKVVEEEKTIENTKNKKGIIIFLIIIVILMLGVAALFWWGSNKNKSENIDIVEEELTTTEALDIAFPTYYKIMDIYLFESTFILSPNLNEKVNGYEITNYNEILKENFTGKAMKEFEDYRADSIKKVNNKYYFMNNIEDIEIDFTSRGFELKNKTSKKIECNITSTISVDDPPTKFILIKEKDKWLVDHFEFTTN